MSAGTITINGSILSQNVTGVQRYAREIIHEIVRQAGDTKLCLATVGRDISETLEGVEPILSAALPRPLWTQTILPGIARGVLLSLGNIGPIAYRNQILCIHDVNTILAPHSYTALFRLYYRLLQPILGRSCRQIASVSRFSADMLVRHRIVGSRHVEVAPNGHEHVRRWDASRSTLAERVVLPERFVFALGSRARHKNLQIVEQFADELARQGIGLVVAGGSSRFFSEVGPASRSSNLLHVGSVTDDDLAYLYERATLFVFPSITEGFGLPALEAMALGCPLVSSSAASLPEVCGDAALYANPERPAEWLAAVTALAASETRREELRARGHAQALRFSWAESARLYLGMAKCLSA